MKTKAVRIYGKKDLRLDEFELPPLKDDEILAKVVTDSICMSTHKAVLQGTDHKRIPKDININPTIIGHEFAGIIVDTGKKWRNEFHYGQKFSIQPALIHKGTLEAPGYSFRYIGGDATYIIIPSKIIDAGCLLPYEGESFFEASLSEPMSCIIGAMHASYHVEPGTYNHEMGIKKNGKMAILGGAGPMGLGAIDYTLHNKLRPSLLVVSDIDNNRLNRAKSLFPPERVKKEGIDLVFLNTNNVNDPVKLLRDLTGGLGFDDVFIYSPDRTLIKQGDSILGIAGCMNFFAGPTNTGFTADINFYNIHYSFTHIMGTSGGNTDDMKEALKLMSEGKINPAMMITHIGGLDSVIDTTLNLPKIEGGKKLIYTNISMPLTALTDLEKYRNNSKLYTGLNEIVSKNNFIWSDDAEKFLLTNAGKI